MSAEGFLSQKQRHPVAMAAALSINLAAVTALMLAKMGVPIAPPGVIELINPTLDPPKPEPVSEPPRSDDPVIKRPVYVPDKVVDSDPVDTGTSVTGTGDPPVTGSPGDGQTGTRGEPQPTPTSTPTPVITEATPLGSAARDFQPPYPSQLLRMGVEGKAVVRVLIGTDGRVKQVAVIAADDPLFAEATERQALRKWRFKPGTRDGVPAESWKQMTVRFEIRS
jgi:protein TonB